MYNNDFVFLDTETTGFKKGSKNVAEGHSIVEIALLRLRHDGTLIPYQQYINPMHEIDPEAFKVHGLSRDFLASYPTFKECAAQIQSQLQGARLIAHNASFDLAFLDEEFARISYPHTLSMAIECVDTLAIARKKFPGQRNSLDALCLRFGISIAHRSFHGALKDCYLLAEVYKALNFDKSTNHLTMTERQAEEVQIFSCNVTDLEQHDHERFLQKYCS